MVYRVLGLMSGSALDGLDLAFVELQESSRKWQYKLLQTACFAYPPEWVQRLRNAHKLNALDYMLLHTDYGHYLGEQVNRFIEAYHLQYQVQLIASHGHTIFHAPARRMTAQIGDGAAIAATTGINVVSDLRAMDLALGGQGAPIVPVGEQLLFGAYSLFLNLGGIANITFSRNGKFYAFDVCPANRVLNLLAAEAGKPYDDGGAMAAQGVVATDLLDILNGLEYYRLPYPKSLSNDFGTEVIFPLIDLRRYDLDDALCTYVEHIAQQVTRSVAVLKLEAPGQGQDPLRMLITGGGAHNHFLTGRLREQLSDLGVEAVVPEAGIVDYKEALIMALIGVLRWREENNTYASVTGARRNAIGGAMWIGQEF